MDDRFVDRGVIKWTSLMLPEHVEKLKEAFAEDKKKEKPILDEQQLWENEAMLQSALKEDLPVMIKYYNNHDFHHIKGHLLHIDFFGKIIIMEDGNINLDDVIEVNTE